MQIAVTAIIRCFLAAFIIVITQMIFHLTIQHGLKHGTENIFKGILHIFNGLWLIFTDDSLSQGLYNGTMN